MKILSPISDKSQEQSSEQGDPSKTPKISPTDHILACCGANTNTEDENHADANISYTKLNHFNNNNSISNNSNNNNNNNNNLSEGEPSPAPFSMPKLQRRLREQQQQQLDRRREFSGAHGSDSGISMASQDVLDIYELLQVGLSFARLCYNRLG